MTQRSTIRRSAAVAAVVLVLAACGSGDDVDEVGAAAPADEPEEVVEEPEAPADEDATDEEATDGGEPEAGGDEQTPPPDEEEVDVDVEGDDDGDDDTILIDDFDDIPGECVDLMGEFLREIEDDVSVVDWKTATIADIEEMGTTLDVPMDDFDDRMDETGCNRYEIGVDDDQSLEFAIRVAEREAPGTVGWLEFIASFATMGETVDDVTGMDEGSGGETGSAGPEGDLPTDCEGTKAYLLERADEYGTIENVPVSETMTLLTAIQNLTVQCTLDDATAFYENPTIQAFLEG